MADEQKPPREPLILKKVKFKIDTYVYLKTDPYQYRRQVVCIRITPNGYLYEVKHDVEVSIHYDIELSETRDENLLNQTRAEDQSNEDDE